MDLCSTVKIHNRLPSLDNLLESEVILGDDDDGSSCSGDDSQMQSALEELSELANANTCDFKLGDSKRASPSAAAAETNFPLEEASRYGVDLNISLPLTQSCYQEMSPTSDFSSLSLTKSYYKEKESPSRSKLARSNSTMTSSFRSPSRLVSPRQHPSYAENTTCSKNRFIATSSHSPLSPARRIVSSQQALNIPVASRKQSIYSPGSPRPAVPPKPAALTRQNSNMKCLGSLDSPVSSRRSISASAPPASKQFIATGRQPSVIRSSSSKPVTPTKPATPSKTFTPPKRDERYATLGRRPNKTQSPSAGINSFGTTPMEASFITRDTKTAADKFATLPRRKIKDRPPIPKFGNRESEAIVPVKMETGTLPRSKKIHSPTSSSIGLGKSQQQLQMKPKVVIYLERSSQTELSTEDVQGGQDAAIRLRSLTWQQQHNEEARQLERMLQQSQHENRLLQQQLDEEREERQLVQQELDRTTERVTAMLNSMEGVEKQIDSRGDISDSIIMHLENNLQTSDRAISALQEQLEAQDAALTAQRLELDRCSLSEKALMQQLQENESESREMMEFLQAEKIALSDAVRDAETEISNLKCQLEETQRQLPLKEEECQHLVRLAEQRRHELAALKVDMKGSEIRNGSVLIAQGAQISAAAEALSQLHTRMDGLLKSLLKNHSIVSSELEAVVFSDETQEEDHILTLPTSSNFHLEDSPHILSDSCSLPLNLSNLSLGDSGDQDLNHVPLAGSTSLQDLSDAINLTRRRPPEGREEPNLVSDDKLQLAASLVDRIQETDEVLSKLLRVLQRLILDKDSTLQQLSDEKIQLIATVSAHAIALQEAKEELNKLRRCDDAEQLEYVKMSKQFNKVSAMHGFDAYYNHQEWNADLSTKESHWTRTITQVLDTLPSDILHAHPPLQQLLQNLASHSSHDPNANGSG